MPAKLALVPIAVLVAACSASGAREHVNLPGRTDQLPFSHVVRAGETYYLAGTLGVEASGKPPADAEQEARLMLDDAQKKLALVGLTMDDLVSVTVFCSDLTLYDTFNRVYASYYHGPPPARAFIGSGPLLRGCRFEVQGVAVGR